MMPRARCLAALRRAPTRVGRLATWDASTGNLATRLSLVMGIHKELRCLFSGPERGYVWIGRPNDAFGGRSPLEVMAQGDIFSLARVLA